MPAGRVISLCELLNAPTFSPVSALSTSCDVSQVADVVRSFPGFGFAGSATTRCLHALNAFLSVSGSSGPTGASK